MDSKQNTITSYPYAVMEDHGKLIGVSQIVDGQVRELIALTPRNENGSIAETVSTTLDDSFDAMAHKKLGIIDDGDGVGTLTVDGIPVGRISVNVTIGLDGIPVATGSLITAGIHVPDPEMGSLGAQPVLRVNIGAAHAGECAHDSTF